MTLILLCHNWKPMTELGWPPIYEFPRPTDSLPRTSEHLFNYACSLIGWLTVKSEEVGEDFFRLFFLGGGGGADTTISPLSIGYVSGAISGQLPTRTIPHCVLMSGFTTCSLYTWSWWGVVLGIMGPGGQKLGFISIWWGIVPGIVVLLGNSWTLFIFWGIVPGIVVLVGNRWAFFFWWEIVLGIVVQVGNSWALFFSGGELS